MENLIFLIFLIQSAAAFNPFDAAGLHVFNGTELAFLIIGLIVLGIILGLLGNFAYQRIKHYHHDSIPGRIIDTPNVVS